MRRFIASVASFLLASVVLSAQEVCGLDLGTRYSYSSIVENFGEPLSKSGDTWTTYQDLTYDGLQLCFDGGEFWKCIITGDSYVVFEDLIAGGVRVGDDVAKVAKARKAAPKKASDGRYLLFQNSDWMNAEVEYDSGANTITSIKVYMPY